MHRLTNIVIRTLILCAANACAFAQGSINQFADFNTGPNSVAAGSLGNAAVFFDARTFFIATTRDAGAELWVTDGSALNTRLFADICPGRCPSTPSAFYVEGSNLYFAADDGRRGSELWRIAAGASAPVLVADINPGAPGSNPARFDRISFAVGGTPVSRTFFAATRQAEGREIWRLNASGAPTVALELDLAPGPVSSDPRDFTVLNTLQVGVTARTPNIGNEIYALTYASTSSPATGAILLSEFGTNAQRTASDELTTLGPNTYVRIFDRNTFKDELWVTQGSPGSTIKLRTASVINEPNANGSLFRVFFASGTGSAKTLSVTDGSVAGTIDLTASTVDPSGLVSIGGNVLFTGFVGAGNGRELFRSNGTVAGTVFMKELVAGASGIPSNAVVKRSANGARMLIGYSEFLWSSDATSAGTVEISGAAIQGEGDVLSVLPTTAGSAMVGFEPDTSSASEPFFTDGTAAGTVALGNFVSDVGDSFPSPLASINGRLIFSGLVADSVGSVFGVPLSGVDGLQPLGTFSGVASGTHFGKVWFRSFDGLVQSDGTSAGTSVITGMRPEIRGPECVITRNGARYFIGRGASFSDVEIYRSDGSAANTTAVTDFSDDQLRMVEDFCFDGFRTIAAFGDKLFFVADDQAGAGLELHMLNAADQASLVADIRAGSGSPEIFDLIALDDRIVFAANDGIFGRELWVTTGTAQGTARLADINPGLGAGDPVLLSRVGDEVFFTAFEPGSGRELYATDGTAAGTRRVRDLFAGAGSAFAIGAFSGNERFHPVIGNRLFFPAVSSAEPQCTLFESDGSSAGTRCAYDSNVIALGPVQEAVALASGALVFTATRTVPDDGEELRVLFNRQLLNVSGGDVAPGSAGSAPERLLVAGNSVFFRANDGVTGAELWRLDLPDLAHVFADGFE